MEAASPLKDGAAGTSSGNKSAPRSRQKHTLGSSWVLETPLGHAQKEEWDARDPLGAQLLSPRFLGDLWDRRIRSSFMPHKLHRCQSNVTGN